MMAKTFKLPKRINGFRLPKQSRKQTNQLLAGLRGDEVDALLGVMQAALSAHAARRDKDGGDPLANNKSAAVTEGPLPH